MTTTIEEQINQLTQTLSASEGEGLQKMRMAAVKQAFDGMNDEEKKEARKAMGEDHTKLKMAMKKAMGMEDNDKMKNAMKKAMAMIDDKKEAADDEEEEDKKDAKSAMDDEEEEKTGKKAMEEEDKKDAMDDEKDKKIAALTASVTLLMAKPIVEKMTKARLDAGMPPKEVEKFQKSLYGKSLNEIKARNAEDQILYKKENPLVASEPNDAIPSFNGNVQGIITSLDASDGDQPLEALYS